MAGLSLHNLTAWCVQVMVVQDSRYRHAPPRNSPRWKGGVDASSRKISRSHLGGSGRGGWFNYRLIGGLNQLPPKEGTAPHDRLYVQSHFPPRGMTVPTILDCSVLNVSARLPSSALRATFSRREKDRVISRNISSFNFERTSPETTPGGASSSDQHWPLATRERSKPPERHPVGVR
jgi:hypothetical protein